MITEDKSRIYEVETLPPLHNLNRYHSVLSWRYYLNSNEPDETKFKNSTYNYQKANLEKLSDYFHKIDWETNLAGKTIDEINEIIIHKYICTKKKYKKRKAKMA